MPPRHFKVALDVPHRVLACRMLAFIAVDVLFLSFSTAHSFKQGGVVAVLVFLVAQYALSTFGYVLCFFVMHASNTPAQHTVRAGLGLSSGCLLIAAHTTAGVSIAVLALAGLGRGMAWAGRQWLELHITTGANREQYVALLGTVSTLLKVVLPPIAVGLAYFSTETLQPLLASCALIGAIGVLFWTPAPQLSCPPVGPLHPLRALKAPAYWTNASFFLLDAGGTALRQALFVSGAMASVGSLSAFGLVDAAAALVSAVALSVLTIRPRAVSCVTQLTGSMLLQALAWASLLLIRHPAWSLGVFVGLYAISQSLLQTVKASLILKGLAAPGVPLQDSAVARALLQFVARGCVLLLGAALTLASYSPQTALPFCICLLLALLPFEWAKGRTLAKGPEPSSVA